jgi:FkbH-like protein
VRYTEDEIEKIANDSKYLTLYYTLKDKFGDHGLVSVVILEKRSDSELFIDTWLMSCRVLKRGMEEFIVNKMIEAAKASGFTKLSAEYIPTLKNSMVKDIYKTFGFTETAENKYVINVDDYEPRKVYIEENK